MSVQAPEAPVAPSTIENRAVQPWLVRGTRLLDDAFTLPGTRVRLGLDSLVGLVPGVGDAVTFLFGYLLLREAKRLGVPRLVRVQMIGYYLLDLIVGAVPFVGDLFDVAFKANRKNLGLIERHLRRTAARDDR